MKYFTRLMDGLDVAPILAELDAAPDLWNQYRERKDAAESPHAVMDDVWVRYFPREQLQVPQDFVRENRCVFYPAWTRLPSLHHHVFALMAALHATELGGLLITRIPSAGRILPHDDRGSWHAEFFNTKIYIPLRSNARCVNRCLDEEVNMRVGEVWTFNNLVEHEVENGGRTDRITAILCIRTE